MVLDNVRSMNNVGSIFRTADAFLVQKLVLCGITGTPPHREITKTAIGAEKSLQWEYEKSTLEPIQKLKAQGYILIALEQADGALDLMKNELNFSPVAFILGNEIDDEFSFCPTNGKELGWLGYFIGKNTNLQQLHINSTPPSSCNSGVEDFRRGMAQNKSIQTIMFTLHPLESPVFELLDELRI